MKEKMQNFSCIIMSPKLKAVMTPSVESQLPLNLINRAARRLVKKKATFHHYFEANIKFY